MENNFKILTFQSKISCKRDETSVMYFSNIVELKCYDTTRTSSECEIKKQPTCVAYPLYFCDKNKTPCSFPPQCKSCDPAGRQTKSCTKKPKHILPSYPQKSEYISSTPRIAQKPDHCKK